MANLELVDASGNLQHAYDTGLKRQAFKHYKAVGESAVERVQQLLAAGQTHRQIAAAVGISAATVSRIRTGAHFSHRAA